MRELIKYGAKLDIQNSSQGNTALHSAAMGNKLLQAVPYALDKRFLITVTVDTFKIRCQTD